jgi:DNA polymerase-3 subunit delta'
MVSNPLFPWQQSAWIQLQLLRQRMPHAILLHGAEGTGKTVFAEHLAQSLLCETPVKDGHACGNCVSCGWVLQYSHPDYRRIRPELLEEEAMAGEAESVETEKKSAKATKAPSKEIIINQIRGLSDFMNISTHRQGMRVIVLYPAEALNVPAANALLKSLEEPNAHTVFILVSHSVDKLLPTILSRCHKFSMGMPSKEQALNWLKMQRVNEPDVWLAQQGGSPLLALQMSQSEGRTDLEDFLRQLSNPGVESSLKIAEKMQKMEISMTVSWLQRWLYDIFSFRQSGRIRYYPGYKKEIALLATRVKQDALLKIIKSTGERQVIASHPLSAKLFLEDMMLDYSVLFR